MPNCFSGSAPKVYVAMSGISQPTKSEDDEDEWELSDDTRAQVALLENPDLVTDE